MVPVQQLALIVVAFNAEEAVQVDVLVVQDAVVDVETLEDVEETVRVVVLDAKEVAVDVLDLALEAVLEAVPWHCQAPQAVADAAFRRSCCRQSHETDCAAITELPSSSRVSSCRLRPPADCGQWMIAYV